MEGEAVDWAGVRGENGGAKLQTKLKLGITDWRGGGQIPSQGGSHKLANIFFYYLFGLYVLYNSYKYKTLL